MQKIILAALVVCMLVALVVSQTANEEERRKKGVTLTFVFDSTGSMRNELEQVKREMQNIFNLVYNHAASPVYNYALVPFNDPSVGPATVTRDPVSFNNSLKAITVHEGGDCPEMSVGGVKLGLEKSLPESFIYVFTDASAKDLHLVKEVLPIIQRRQSQVDFLLTGMCNGYDDPGYKAYKDISSASGGQVFNLKKEDIKSILNYVKDTIQRKNKVVMVALDKPAGSSSFDVPVDATMVVLTTSVSGGKPRVIFIDPHGNEKIAETVVNIPGGLVVKIPNPEPGIWKVAVSSDAPHTIRVVSDSDFNFDYGFSTIPTTNMDETAVRPLGGAETSLILKVTNSSEISGLNKLIIRKEREETVLIELNLIPVPGHPNLYTVDKFTPPLSPFVLEVVGMDTKGNEVRRKSRTTITPQTPDSPFVEIPPAIESVKGEPFDIICKVESLVPFTAKWLKNGRAYGPEQSFKQSAAVKLHLTEVTKDTEGKYTCQAKNLVGTTSGETQLTMTASPPKVDTPEKITVRAGIRQEIPCNIVSELPFNVSWYITLKSSSSNPYTDPRFQAQYSGILVIDPVRKEDEGSYLCTAQSKAGKGEDRIQVEVREPVHVTVKPATLTIELGGSAEVSCTATGTPPLNLRWKKNGKYLKATDPRLRRPSKDTLILKLKNMSRRAVGRYECEAKNDVDKDVGVVELMYPEIPTATMVESFKEVLRGSDVVLECDVTGDPKPKVSWSLNGQDLHPNSDFIIRDDGSLIIRGVNDGGEYKCSAVNKLGKSEDTMTLRVTEPIGTCPPGSTMQYTCITKGDVHVCTKEVCVPKDRGHSNSGPCTPGSHFDSDDGCNVCLCPENGQKKSAACSSMACED